MTLAAISCLLAVAPATAQQDQGQTSRPGDAPAARPLVFPDQKIILPGLNVVSIDGKNYWSDQSGRNLAQVPTAGTWKSIESTTAPGQKHQSRAKIYIASNIGVTGKDAKGHTTARRLGIDKDDIDQINDATKLVRRLLLNLPVNSTDLVFTLQEEADPFYFTNVDFTPGNEDQHEKVNRWLYENIVTPKTNTSKFESDDPTDYGPYDLVVLIHMAPTSKVSEYTADGRKVIVYPFLASNSDPALDLAEAISASYLKYCLPTASIPTAQGQTVAWTNPVPEAPYATGDYSMAYEADTLKVTRRYGNTVGYASLTGHQESLAPAGKLKLNFSIKSPTPEPYTVELLSDEGKILASAQVSGDVMYSWPGSVRARVPFDDTWQNFQAVFESVPEPVAEVRLVPYPTQGVLRRFTTGESVVEIKGLTLTTAADTDSTVNSAPPTPADAFRAEFLDLPAEFPAAKWTSLRDGLLSEDTSVRIAAAELLTRTKFQDPEAQSVQLLGAIASSANDEAVMMATTALAFQGTPEANDALKTIVEKGPFTFNRLTAWQQIKDLPKEANWIKTATMLSVQQSWLLRLNALDLYNQVGGEPANVAILTGFQDFDPSVRAHVPIYLDPNVEFFARRLIFSGVNDASEAVRAACMVRLLGTSISRIRTEAHRGVRDESLSVRLVILNAIKERKNSDDRPALQLAMTDTNPVALAATLDAYATQPGEVQTVEIQTAFATKSPEVATSLVKLAIAKSLKLPTATVSNLRGLNNSEVNRLLDELGG